MFVNQDDDSCVVPLDTALEQSNGRLEIANSTFISDLLNVLAYGATSTNVQAP